MSFLGLLQKMTPSWVASNEMCILSQFWRLQVQNQGGTWDGLPTMAPGKSPSWWLRSVPGVPWGAAASVFVFTWPPVCVPVSSLPNSSHWM